VDTSALRKRNEAGIWEGESRDSDTDCRLRLDVKEKRKPECYPEQVDE
jgi:hypothetical protein